MKKILLLALMGVVLLAASYVYAEQIGEYRICEVGKTRVCTEWQPNWPNQVVLGPKQYLVFKATRNVQSQQEKISLMSAVITKEQLPSAIRITIGGQAAKEKPRVAIGQNKQGSYEVKVEGYRYEAFPLVTGIIFNKNPKGETESVSLVIRMANTSSTNVSFRIERIDPFTEEKG